MPAFHPKIALFFLIISPLYLKVQNYCMDTSFYSFLSLLIYFTNSVQVVKSLTNGNKVKMEDC